MPMHKSLRAGEQTVSYCSWRRKPSTVRIGTLEECDFNFAANIGTSAIALEIQQHSRSSSAD